MDRRQVHRYPHPAQTGKLRLGARRVATSSQGTGSKAILASNIKNSATRTHCLHTSGPGNNLEAASSA